MKKSIVHTFKLFCNQSIGRLKSINIKRLTNYNLQRIMPLLKENDVKDPSSNENKLDNFKWLHDVAPAFSVDATKITILHEPSDFYSTLVARCKQAQKRITLVSLYLGTGRLEKDLVEAIEKSIIASNGQMQVNILLDYLRGTRGQSNSRTSLEPLLHENYADNCKISLYHTPNLRGFLKAIIPSRFNELIGLQHMKVYIFDDALIISGANLSHDYFSNRQDRYFLIEDCKELCDFYIELIRRIAQFSFQLLPGNIISSDTPSGLHPLKTPIDDFTRAARDDIYSFYIDELNKRRNVVGSDEDTRIFPLIQMGQFGIHHDCQVTLRLFKSVSAGSTLRLATGYFNLTSEYSNAILKDCRASCELLTAHPTANGFFGAKGVAGGIPAAYTSLEKSFYASCERLGVHKRITLKEYARHKWTYHAKGLWYTLPNQRKPSLTFIGSPNFGYRSVKRDVETQIAIVTKNERLKNALEEEYLRLYRHSETVTKNTLSQRDRIVPAWVCAVVLLFRYYF